MLSPRETFLHDLRESLSFAGVERKKGGFVGVSLRAVTVRHKWCFLPSELKIEVKVRPVSHGSGLASLTLTRCSGLGRKGSDLLDIVEAVISDPRSSASSEEEARKRRPQTPPTHTCTRTHSPSLCQHWSRSAGEPK